MPRHVPYREAAIRAILNMLDGTLRKAVYKMVMDFSKIPEGPVHRYLREKFEARGEKRGEKRGEAEALLTVLAARSIGVDAAAHERIASCSEAATLTAWIARAATATSLTEVFGTPVTPPREKKPARRTSTRKSRT